MERKNGFKISQYACAVLLIVSSIALVAYQVIMIDDVSNGLPVLWPRPSCSSPASSASTIMLNLSPRKSMENTTINDTRLSPHFKLGEFIKLSKYPDNKPTMQDVANITYGCLMLLEPARQVVGPILINSGFRNARVNALVGGVKNSQHLMGQAADIRSKDPRQFSKLVDFLRPVLIPTNF